MERSEPAFMPEWLKPGGTTGGGSTSHQIASSSCSSLLLDDPGAPRSARYKSSGNVNDRTIGRPLGYDRSPSLYFQQSSSSSALGRSRSYSSSFVRSKDRENDEYDSLDKVKSILGNYKHRSFSDKDMTAGKQGDIRKVMADSSNTNKNYSNGLLPGSSAINSMHKVSFERDFPSLVAEERQAAYEVVRVPSPISNTSIQTLPMGSSSVIGADGWTSALAEVPVTLESNGAGGSVHQSIPATPLSVASSMTTNMAGTLAKITTRVHTSQLSSGTQRLEERALKQSLQLIPMKPSVPKASALNPSEKPKLKIGQQQISSSHHVNHSPRSGPTKCDISKTTSVGKLHVLKPARERNGISSTAKDSLSLASGNKVASSSVAVSPSAVGSPPLRSSSSKPYYPSSERKPFLAISEKRPSLQAQSRNDFFNLVRKNSAPKPSDLSCPVPAASSSVLEKSDVTENDTVAIIPQGRDSPSSNSSVEDWSSEKRGDMISNGNACDRQEDSVNNGKNHSSLFASLHSEEEEIAFLHSLGWEEENGGEDEGLTEEEIAAFYSYLNEYKKSSPSSRALQRINPKFLVPLNLQTECVDGAASSGFNSSDSKPQS